VKSELRSETEGSGINGSGNGEFSSRPVDCPDCILPNQADADFPLMLPRQHNGHHNNLVVSESFSILRSRLLKVHNKLGIKSVVITSAESGDGKTVVAVNLAMSLAQLGSKRILLIDGDLRAGDTTRILNLKYQPGIADFLQGNKGFEAVIHVVGSPSLSIAPTGFVPNRVLPEILEGPCWSEFLEQAKEKFDLIIVDCLPASAPVADVELVTAPCDAILLVVYMRHTRREALKRATARMDSKKFLGIILNNSDEIYKHDYSYYDSGSRSSPQPDRSHPRKWGKPYL